MDFDSLLAELSSPAKTSSKTSSPEVSVPDDIAKAYDMIPKTIIATTTGPHRNPTEQALYDYGNEVGSLIQSFETQHPNEAQVLKDQLEDRTNATKGAAVISIAQGLVGIGDSMQKMDNVPSAAKGMHSALARSYIEIGGKLSLLPQTSNDKDFVAAILAYDSAANTFVRNYAALATYFSVSNVTFSPQDAGSVFSFSSAPQR